MVLKPSIISETNQNEAERKARRAKIISKRTCRLLLNFKIKSTPSAQYIKLKKMPTSRLRMFSTIVSAANERSLTITEDQNQRAL